MAVTTTAALLSYLLMLAAYFLPRQRWLHIPSMLAIMLFDVGMPVYLYTHRDWWHRLIEQHDILSFLVWMHFGLFITLYVLDYMQIQTARKMLRGDQEARTDHQAFGRALLAVRGLVIFTGGILAE